jgi:nucleoside-diphosphate-sugar epimerase
VPPAAPKAPKAPKAVVAGATGIVGRYLIAHLRRVGGWQLVGLARRPDPSFDGVEWVDVDLLDKQACADRLGAIAGATHVFYAARAARDDIAQENADNAAMLVNLVDALEPVSPDLAHINLIHGTKWYGSHAGPFRTPARETDPRGPGPYWYFDQQDFVGERQTGKDWTWSALRPHFVSGVSVRHPHNIMGVMVVYAAVCRELGRPLDFPGPVARYETLTQLTDAGLLAEAMVWAGTSQACANQAYNIGNGDNVRWRYLWPLVADLFGLEVGSVGEMYLPEFMADKGPLWDEMVARHGLAPYRLEELASWTYGAFAFGASWDEMSSSVKARRDGFHAAIDSFDMVRDVIAGYRREKLIP